MLEGSASTAYEGANLVGYEMFGMKAFFDHPWKILRMPDPYGTGEWQLYNLEQDPTEQVDLGPQYPERLEEMIAQWDRYKVENGVLDVDVKPMSLR